MSTDTVKGRQIMTEALRASVDAILNQGDVTREHCRVLYRTSDLGNQTAEEGLKLFDRMCGVIDVESGEAKVQVAAAVPKRLQTGSP